MVFLLLVYYVCGKKKILNRTLAINSPFQTCRTSSQIYRLALLLRTPEMLCSLSKSRISIVNAHLVLFVRRMTQLRSHNFIGKYRHLVN